MLVYYKTVEEDEGMWRARDELNLYVPSTRRCYYFVIKTAAPARIYAFNKVFGAYHYIIQE